MIRVLHVLNELRHSGAETMLRAAGRQWAAQGIHAEVLSKGKSIGPFAGELQHVGYLIHHIPGTPGWRFIRKCTRLIQQRGIDVVHIHTEYRAMLLVLMSRGLDRASAVRTNHNVFPYRGLLRVRKTWERSMARRLGVVQVSVGHSVASNEQCVLQNPSCTISNWIDDDHFRRPTPSERAGLRKAHSIPANASVVVSVGACEPRKNHESIIRALSLIPESRRPVYLHVGDRQPVTAMERRMASMLGLERWVRWMGSVSDVRPYLWMADAFAMPSFNEGFSIAALEALCTGIPLVLSDSPGLRDLRTERAQVMWVEPTASSLAGALEEVRKWPSDWERRSASVEQELSARRKYGVRGGVEAYGRLYERVLYGALR